MALPDVDYHREKYGLVALAGHLVSAEGWTRALLSVPPESLDEPGGPRGIVPPVIDAELDRTDPHYAYDFYTDLGGHIDLVAVRPGHLLIVEAKGTSVKVPAGIEQLIGRLVLAMDPERDDRSYAILIPDLPKWLAVVAAARHPVLAPIGVYTVSAKGRIGRAEWASTRSRAGQEGP
jgi:hypothetical protein